MWFFHALLAMFCFAGMQLLFKQLSRSGLGSPVILVFVFGIGTLFYLAHVAIVRAPLVVGANALAMLGAAALLSYTGNLYMVRALDQAPNPGYAIAVVGLQALVVTLGGVVLFGSEFSWVKALGVTLSICGVALLMLDG
jgi:drug/metabolite transporter (DMT)-like permease